MGSRTGIRRRCHEVTVTVRLSGALAPIWKRFMGAGMRDAARSSVEGLLASLDRTKP